MPFSVGDTAIVRAFGNKRGDIIAMGRDGRYQLRIEGVTMWCREEELATPKEAKKTKAGRSKPVRPEHTGKDLGCVVASGRLDLHGLIVEEALARLTDEIDRSLLRGADRIEVSHGKGSGRVRDAVHRYLASMPVVAAFRLDPVIPGVTWVHFR
jgi:DNA mismatch repair protein MutS2